MIWNYQEIFGSSICQIIGHISCFKKLAKKNKILDIFHQTLMCHGKTRLHSNVFFFSFRWLISARQAVVVELSKTSSLSWYVFFFSAFLLLSFSYNPSSSLPEIIISVGSTQPIDSIFSNRPESLEGPIGELAETIIETKLST